MASTHVDLARAEWVSGVTFYGPGAVYEGRDIVQLKILSDRRAEGGGIAWLGKFSPPAGKLIKIVATALSDEHVFNLEGGRGTKSGGPARSSGGYTLNPEGQPHSAFIGTETVSLIVYRGEPDEIDAIAVGARHVRRLRDPKLQEAADSVLAKVTAILPEMLRPHLAEPPFYVSEGSAPPPTGVDLAEVRGAIHEARKMTIDYADDKGRRTHRTIWPIAMAYYVDVSLIGAWCELRQDFRSFRVDRILNSRLLDEHFSPEHGRLAAAWLALSKEAPGTPT